MTAKLGSGPAIIRLPTARSLITRKSRSVLIMKQARCPDLAFRIPRISKDLPFSLKSGLALGLSDLLLGISTAAKLERGIAYISMLSKFESCGTL